jgi:hypothetical protein
MSTHQSKDMGAIRSMATRIVMEKTNRLLGWDGRVKVLKPMEVTEPDGQNAPAWTNGKTITINGRQEPLRGAFINGFDKETMLVVTGLNYHELAHCFFTPRLDSGYVANVRNHGWFQALNALEDQAAESRFVRLYSPSRHYFTAIIAKLMAGEQECVTKNYPLIAGRKFLPTDLRRLFRSNFVRPDLIPDFEQVIDAYCDAIYPDDEGVMFSLVERYHILIMDALGNHPSPTSTHGDLVDGDGGPGHGITGGEMLPVGERRRVAGLKPVGEDISGEPLDEEDEEEKLGKVANNPPIIPTPDPEAEDPSNDKDPDEEGSQKPSKGSEEEDEAGDESDGSEAGTEAPDGPPGGRGAGHSKKRGKKYEPADLDEILQTAIEDAFEEVAQDLHRREEAVRFSEDQYEVDATPSPFKTRAVESHHTHIARQVEKALRRLNQKFKPGWHRRQESGKLNSNDAARMRRGETDVFKRFSPGVNNALSFEVVLLLDQSGSMYQLVKQSADALWILHKAMKSVNAEITVLGYSDHDQCKVLMQRGEPTPKQVHDYFVGSSTYVMPALEETSRIFRVTRKPLRLCVVVTDGCFSDPEPVGEWLHASKDPVAIVGIGADVHAYWNPDRYRALKVSKTIQSPLDLVPLVQELVTQLSSERYTKR